MELQTNSNEVKNLLLIWTNAINFVPPQTKSKHPQANSVFNQCKNSNLSLKGKFTIPQNNWILKKYDKHDQTLTPPLFFN